MLAAMLFPLCAFAQMLDPVKFKVETKKVSDTEIDVTFTGKIEGGWHVYSTNVPDDGPTPATFHMDNATNIERLGALQAGSGAIRKLDKVFEAELEFFENSCHFTQRLKITGKDYSAKGYLEYGACSNVSCMPPTQVDFSVKGNDGPDNAPKKDEKAEVAAQTAIADTVSPLVPADTTSAAQTAVSASDSAALWASQTELLNAQNGMSSDSHRSLLVIFLLGVLGGFVALLTPCVWPIIPMTVSFFLHRQSERRKAVRDAILYGVAIIVIYVGLGLVVTSIWGANKLNALSTNAIFNIFFFLLLVVFAASFLGGFDITLPSSWGNKVNSKSRSTSGMASIFLMALTLAIVSFSCTGPVIGFLLVEVSSTGKILAPALGMLGFAIALALPFAFFALFPAVMKKMPKSGGWMNTVKVTLGFVELAFALKFLSVADLAYGWHILDRETFLALWIAIFAVAAFYLFGLISIHGDRGKDISVTRLFLGLASLAFAIYMVPGLWGAPLKAVSAFAPPMNTQDFRLGNDEVSATYTDYHEGMKASAATGKPVLLDFTGYGCVNCRKMEASVWTDPGVSRLLKEKFILVSLYTDDKTPLPNNVEVNINGKRKTLRTVGDKWSYLQQIKFGANAQPFYVAVNQRGVPLAGSYAFDENPANFENYLKKALKIIPANLPR
ncbi:MAG: cytochrome c biogenesis protein CcdA [Prevotellaceae bacterium]|nr:cytochrome c biogenesis protein CcdA [Prevotellaceae bacterium]